jgi:hypothetical protein
MKNTALTINSKLNNLHCQALNFIKENKSFDSYFLGLIKEAELSYKDFLIHIAEGFILGGILWNCEKDIELFFMCFQKWETLEDFEKVYSRYSPEKKIYLVNSRKVFLIAEYFNKNPEELEQDIKTLVPERWPVFKRNYLS